MPIAPEYFNNSIAVDGEIIVKTVPNNIGSVLVWNPVTKKMSTRTNAEIISDLGVATQYWVSGNYFPRNADITIPRNANNFTLEGVYYGYQWQNVPANNIGILTVKKYSPDWIVQEFEAIDGLCRKWIRNRTFGTTWSPWKEQALSDGTNATGGWRNHSYGLVQNPGHFGTTFGAAGVPSDLQYATYGEGMGYINTAGVAGGCPDDNWWYRLKMLHANSTGYNGEIALQMTGGHGIQYRKMEGGVESGWTKTLDERNTSFPKDIVKEGNEVRLNPLEFRLTFPIDYIDIEDPNRLIHVINKSEKATINIKGLFPKQQYVIYNLDPTYNDFMILIQDTLVYNLVGGKFIRIYVTENLEVIAEDPQPCSIIW